MMSNRSKDLCLTDQKISALFFNPKRGPHLFQGDLEPILDLPWVLAKTACQALLAAPAGCDRNPVGVMQDNGAAMARILHRVERRLQLSMLMLSGVEVQQDFCGTGFGIREEFESFDTVSFIGAFDVLVFDREVDEVARYRSLEFFQLIARQVLELPAESNLENLSLGR